MIDKSTALETVLEKLQKLPTGHALDLRTYKRNRSILIRKTADNTFDIVQNGYESAEFSTDIKKMRKLLKTLFKKEFPRSTKIRLYTLGPEHADTHLPRKVI